MKAQIKKIIHYTMYREDYFEAVYESGRIVTHRLPDLPKTFMDLINNSKEAHTEYTKVFNRYQTIYTM